MAAYSISNACNYRQAIEDRYMDIVGKYTRQDAEDISNLLAFTIEALQENRKQDFLGELYMEFGFGDKKKGEYFTPYYIAAAMAKMNSNDGTEERYIKIIDPACGSGVLLIAFTNNLIEQGIDHHLKALVIANDIDPCISLMCYIQLSLLGCAGYVCIRDTFTEPMVGNILVPPEDAFIMPLFLHPIWKFRRELL